MCQRREQRRGGVPSERVSTVAPDDRQDNNADRYWACDDAWGYRVRRRRDFPLAEVFSVAERHRRGLQNGPVAGCEVRERSERSAVTICDSDAGPFFGDDDGAGMPNHAPGGVCVKSFWSIPWKERVKDAFRPVGRATHAWHTLRRFQRLGIPSARPLAVLERHNPFGDIADFLVMENLAGTRNLYEFVTGAVSKETLARVGRAVARLIDLLCEKKIYHPDLKPENFLVRVDDGRINVWVIDMARVKFHSRSNEKRWVRYLAQLNSGLPDDVSLLDRMRFLRECGAGRWDDAERELIARRVLEKSFERDIQWTYRGAPGQRGAGWTTGN